MEPDPAVAIRAELDLPEEELDPVPAAAGVRAAVLAGRIDAADRAAVDAAEAPRARLANLEPGTTRRPHSRW